MEEKVAVYQRLAARYGWTFETIARMTPQQHRAALAGEKDEDSELLRFSTWADYQRYRQASTSGFPA